MGSRVGHFKWDARLENAVWSTPVIPSYVTRNWSRERSRGPSVGVDDSVGHPSHLTQSVGEKIFCYTAFWIRQKRILRRFRSNSFLKHFPTNTQQKRIHENNVDHGNAISSMDGRPGDFVVGSGLGSPDHVLLGCHPQY